MDSFQKIGKTGYFVLSFTIIVASFAYLYKTYDFSGLTGAIRFHWFYFYPLVIGASLLTRWLASLQVSKLLRHHQVMKSGFDVFRYQSIASMYTLMLPGSLAGSGISLFLLTKDNQKYVAATSSLAYVRILDTLFILLSSCVVFLLDPVIIKSIDIRGMFLAAGILFVLLLPFISPAIYTRMAEFVKKIPYLKGKSKAGYWIKRILSAAEESSRIGRTQILNQALYALLGVFTGAMVLKIAAMMVGVQLPLAAFFWIRGLLLVITMLPVAFAGLGVREVALVTLLQHFYQIPPENGLLLSLVAFANTIVMSLGVGGLMHFYQKKK